MGQFGAPQSPAVDASPRFDPLCHPIKAGCGFRGVLACYVHLPGSVNVNRAIAPGVIVGTQFGTNTHANDDQDSSRPLRRVVRVAG